MKKALITSSIALSAVLSAYASGGISVTLGTATGGASAGGQSLLSLLALAQTLVARLVPFLIGLAVIVFFWFLVEFIAKGKDSAEKRTEGLEGMLYAVLALFVMVSVWGLVGFLGSFLGIGQGGIVNTPGIPLP
jgi:hypothetical protein